MLVALLHLASVAAMAGLSWVVLLSAYPGFADVGPTDRWPEHHGRHVTAMARLVPLPYATQGVTTAWLLLTRPGPLTVAAAVLGAATVAVTALWSVPRHTALGARYDDDVLRSLLTSHRWRTALWTAGTVVALLVAREAAA